MSPKGARRVWALIGVAFGWVTVAFFGLAPASALVSFLAGAVGRPVLVKATAFTATVECCCALRPRRLRRSWRSSRG